MSTTSLARLLDQELDRLAPRYASVHGEHARLAPYPTLASLVDRLTEPKKNKSAEAQRERSELSRPSSAPSSPRTTGSGARSSSQRSSRSSRRRVSTAPIPRNARRSSSRRWSRWSTSWTSGRGPTGPRHRLAQRQEDPRPKAPAADVPGARWASETKPTRRPTRLALSPSPCSPAWLLSRGKEDRPDLDLVVRVQEWGSSRRTSTPSTLRCRRGARAGLRTALKRSPARRPPAPEDPWRRLTQPRSRGTVPPPREPDEAPALASPRRGDGRGSPPSRWRNKHAARPHARAARRALRPRDNVARVFECPNARCALAATRDRPLRRRKAKPPRNDFPK